ncbi:hypothetical protein J4440_01585 [Candidatus Woesearchaeota archaeon]|nr:hypothetical protein [Candidatus Woesearchaeota archaeon]
MAEFKTLMTYLQDKFKKSAYNIRTNLEESVKEDFEFRNLNTNLKEVYGLMEDYYFKKKYIKERYGETILFSKNNENLTINLTYFQKNLRITIIEIKT